ncbi:glutathione S-transferase family protein [Caballeronia insecticola]|uniref:Glutathione S-transferase domain n=1 Tax=Caballeronia insecticola TaxID=758793 RepID=R4WP25_9BURK|nr:glutathione S-transferase family protein [Caballeronia insecticola]BAN26408.1 glutathione S-transferase domain [Caballeronia insecticola]
MTHIPYELFGARTGNCIRVAIAFEEAGLPYTIRLVDMKQKEHQSAEFMALNPSGKVPVMIDRSRGPEHAPLVLTQSNAILYHLADLAPERLLGSRESRPRAHERFFFFLTDVILPSHAAFWLRTEDSANVARRILNDRAMHAIRLAERFASENAFLGGDTFGLADIAAVTIVHAYERELEWDALPALRRWYEAAMKRPSVARGMRAFDD